MVELARTETTDSVRKSPADARKVEFVYSSSLIYSWEEWLPKGTLGLDFSYLFSVCFIEDGKIKAGETFHSDLVLTSRRVLLRWPKRATHQRKRKHRLKKVKRKTTAENEILGMRLYRPQSPFGPISRAEAEHEDMIWGAKFQSNPVFYSYLVFMLTSLPICLF